MSSCAVSVVSMSSCLHLFVITVFCGSIKGENLFLETSAFRGLSPWDTVVECNNLLPVPKGDDLQLDRQRCLFLFGAPPFWLLAPFGCELIYVKDFVLLFNWSKDFEALDTCRNACPFKFQDAPKRHAFPSHSRFKTPFPSTSWKKSNCQKLSFFPFIFPFSSIPPVFFFPILSEVPLVTATRRPALAPSVVTFSVPDLTYPPIKVGYPWGWDGWDVKFQPIAPTCRDLWVFWWVRVVETKEIFFKQIIFRWDPAKDERKGVENTFVHFLCLCVELDGRWGISPKSLGQGCL